MHALCPVSGYRPSTVVRAAAAVSAFAVVLFPSVHAAAVEPRPDASATSSSGGFDNPYAQPLSALGGETLAQYLVRHHEARLGFR